MMNKIRRMLCTLAALALMVAGVAVAKIDAPHAFEGLPFGMTVSDYEDWLRENTIGGIGPITETYDDVTSVTHYGETDFFGLRALLCAGTFESGGLSQLLLTVEDANWAASERYAEETREAGYPRAIDGYLRLVAALEAAYGPAEDTIMRAGDGLYEALPWRDYPADDEALRTLFLGDETVSVLRRYGNVTLALRKVAAEPEGLGEPYIITDVHYYGPDVPEYVFDKFDRERP